jgi:SNF2 family DNA or RNA helicase
MGEILHALGQGGLIRLQLRAISTVIIRPKNKQKRGDDCQRSASFYAIVYGPFGKFQTVGAFLENYDVCLQTPRGCDSNRRYRNPHALKGLDPDAPYTNDLDLIAQRPQLRAWEGSSSYLDDMEFPEVFLEAETPSAIKTPLYRHQRQGLYFMLQREGGWTMRGDMKFDIWEQILISGVPVYKNTINDDEQLAPPATFRGGILADEMGLGKTLTVAALVASD